MRDAGSNNPLLMVDEIDKMGSMGTGGGPESAMLEVLDPEQNDTFRDHYLDVPFDLSRVMFVTTANTLDTIPGPLRDRMEIIRLAGYTAQEKLEIAKRYLVPRQLERQIGAIARKVAREVAEGGNPKGSIGEERARELLGRKRYHSEAKRRTRVPGVATGLAWTPVGGDVLFIEATAFDGEGKLQITGQLGDVMKESAQAALSYVRSHADGLPEDFFQIHDIHLHVPAGAIPKDGPSAGITMATALVSLITGRSVRSDTAMTGEITLRGRVMPVGGIKEKVLAAKRAGIETIILPRRNEKDLEEVPEAVRHALRFVFVDSMDDVIEHALEPRGGAREPRAANA
jgi:ATP-dependent Lon protease